MKYLYGAAVQGIQSFIFQTNELKDIIGASELVQKICTNLFDELGFKGNHEMIVQAAGNIKCIFDNEEDCKRAVLEFPKKVMNEAPGITISQAVVKYDGEFKDAVDKLEKKLRAQRNRPFPSLTIGLMAIERSRKTGLPAVKVKDNDLIDAGVEKKRDAYEWKQLCEKSFGENVPSSKYAFNIEDLTDHNDWIAVIHADGNGLGKIVQEIGSDPEALHIFSQSLDDATRDAARETYRELEPKFADNKRIPLRPVVLSGDDMTIICRADLAMKYAETFISKFEKKTGQMGHPLTACAGIAFIKSSYPFYYGYNLAEALCEQAKKDSKSKDMTEANDGKVLSSIMFHKVQSSFVEDYQDIVAKELTPAEGHSFNFGPYYLDTSAQLNGRWTVERLMKVVNDLSTDKGNAVKTSLRRWMTAMYNNTERATQLRDRAMTILQDNDFKEMTEGKLRGGVKCYPTYDALSLLTVINQVTNK